MIITPAQGWRVGGRSGRRVPGRGGRTAPKSMWPWTFMCSCLLGRGEVREHIVWDNSSFASERGACRHGVDGVPTHPGGAAAQDRSRTLT